MVSGSGVTHRPPKTMREIEVDHPGESAALRLVKAPVPTIRAGEVLVRVSAAGVNQPDILQRRGIYPQPMDASPVLGLEVCGDIVQLGEGVTEWNPGDRVCALVPGGGYAEYCRTPASSCLPIPRGLSDTEAAALPETFFTVWANIYQIARLKPGETILIHGGSSGIGTAAIQICRALGSRVFVTAGSDEKCQACLKLGADAAINYREEDFVARVLELTGGAGVNVILDMVGAPYLPRNLNALAVEGRLAQIAVQHGSRAEIDLRLVMVRRLKVMGSTLRPRSIEDKAAIARDLRDRIWPLIEAGKIRPIIDRTFPLADADAAHRRIQSGRHIGKVVLTVQ